LDRLPVLAAQEQRLAEAVATSDGSVNALVAALKARQQERQDLESRLAELETWERDAQADRDRVEQLRARWGSWQGALDEDPVLARQVLKKVLATPIYVRPTGRREWTYVGIGRYDGVLNGGVAPGEVVAVHKHHRDACRRPGDVPAGPWSEPGGHPSRAAATHPWTGVRPRVSTRGPPRNQNVSGSVRRTQRPPFTTAKNDELAPWCLSGAKFTSGPLKMSW
jgi:hypothetical protein